MGNAYVTFIETDDYLPGILALWQSLFSFNSIRDFVIVTTSKSLSEEATAVLKSLNIKLKIVDEIKNPLHRKGDKNGFNHYTKLNVFNLTEYKKLIFLDADLIICGNIESLFALPHMSSVVAGGLISENNWTDLNGGLLIIEPSSQLFAEMLKAAEYLPSGDGTDQGFLQSFYKDWPSQEHLHLQHRYNVPVQYLDTYCEKFAFTFSYNGNSVQTNISVLHYWGPLKPWAIHPEASDFDDHPKLRQAINLWWAFYDASLKYL